MAIQTDVLPTAPAAGRTLTEQLVDRVDDARTDMRTAPTATDWILDAAAWLAWYQVLVLVVAVTWPFHLPSRGSRIALLVVTVAAAAGGLTTGMLLR